MNIPTIVITDNPYQENKDLDFEIKNITSKCSTWDFIFETAKNSQNMANKGKNIFL